MKRFKSILYVSDGSVDQTPALARAVTLAENNQAELTVIDVIPRITADIGLFGGETNSADLQEAMARERRQRLELLVKPHSGRLKIKLDVFIGTVFLEIIRAVLRHGYDLVIKTAENPDFMERLFGSDDMHLLRKCPCPVWLMKPYEKSNYSNILAAVDFDLRRSCVEEQSLNQQILELSASLALSDFASLHLAHAWETIAEGKIQTWSRNPAAAVATYLEGERLRHQAGLYQLGEWLRSRIGTEAYDYLSPRFHLRKGEARRVITAMAGELGADLVVMGTVARTGISGLIIGNTAEAIFEQVRCSVLALKPPGFVSPVKLTEYSFQG